MHTFWSIVGIILGLAAIGAFGVIAVKYGVDIETRAGTNLGKQFWDRENGSTNQNKQSRGR